MMPSILSDDELIDMPLANLLPGELKRAFFVQAQQVVKKQEEERLASADLLSLRNVEQQDKAKEDNHRREALLLAALDAREQQLAQAARELDGRTLRLEDGRRVYVDGDKYRDEKGRELHDADRAQAEQHHLEQPHAATWQEKRDLDEQAAANQQMRRQVEELQAGKAGANETALLSRYEKQMHSAAIAPASSSVTDYTDTDYMKALGLTGKPNVKAGPSF